MKRQLGSGLTGLLFGVLVALVYLAACMTDPTAQLRDALLSALLTGLFGGVLFAFYIRRFTKRRASAFDEVRERLSKSCEIQFDAAANHLFNGEYVGGWLFLTDRGLYFAADPMNTLSHTLRLPNEQILSVTLTKQLGFKNGIRIETPRGEEQLILSKPEAWIKRIRP